MRSLKYIFFSFVICFIALNTASAEVCSYVYKENNSEYNYKCSVTNQSISCNFTGLSATYKKVENNNLATASTSEITKLKATDFIDNSGNVDCNKVSTIKVDFNVTNNLSWEVYNVGNISCGIAENIYNNNKGNYLFTRCATFTLKGSNNSGANASDDTTPSNSNSNEFNTNNFCEGSVQGVFTTLGWVFFFLKILIPIILIVFGSIDFGKAMLSNKDDEIKKTAKTLVMRAIAGIIIFFVPTFLNFIVEIIGGNETYNENSGTFARCTHCMLKPSDCRKLIGD